ncbi:Multi antimicrobial extrusion protein [Carpediemonas membranifera]|uniref:Multi antimicrobial extrusion protein n=1 Tax=Carpediemonas membranifera TaxID=201153 RepID=A0A8J6B7N4_9EUKA|nr:Multi antimicrobial extrusion protein [Carpediemonas membranifera]|eukprot:KAG9394442.1 Multi antimicrobial extrusion protein [Carpediemonas membranifera]
MYPHAAIRTDILSPTSTNNSSSLHSSGSKSECLILSSHRARGSEERLNIPLNKTISHEYARLASVPLHLVPWMFLQLFARLIPDRLLATAPHFIDMLTIILLGSNSALTAFAFCAPLTFSVNAVLLCIGTALQAVVSSRLRANTSDVSQLVTETLAVGGLFALVLSFAGVISIYPFMLLVGAPGDVIRDAVPYMIIWWLGSTLISLKFTAVGVVQAFSRNRGPVALALLHSTFRALLCPVLVAVIGLPGVAVAEVIVTGAEASIVIALLAAKFHLLRPTEVTVHTTLANVVLLGRTALPFLETLLPFPLTSIALTAVLARYDTVLVTGFAVAARIVEYPVITWPVSAAMVAAPFVADNVAARRMFRTLVGLALAVVLVLVPIEVAWLVLLAPARAIFGLILPADAADSAALYLRMTLPGVGILCSVLVLAGLLAVTGHGEVGGAMIVVEGGIQAAAVVLASVATHSVKAVFSVYSIAPVIFLVVALFLVYLIITRRDEDARAPPGGLSSPADLDDFYFPQDRRQFEASVDKLLTISVSDSDQPILQRMEYDFSVLSLADNESSGSSDIDG